MCGKTRPGSDKLVSRKELCETPGWQSLTHFGNQNWEEGVEGWVAHKLRYSYSITCSGFGLDCYVLLTNWSRFLFALRAPQYRGWLYTVQRYPE